ncbi:MAG: RNA 2'-phosphotransferase [Anaerolineae bacterium]|nr:RNA 2'-phosphotransferase [Anaerolineae bacterium]
MPLNYTQLSKTVSHALRHAPALYHLELDTEGWVAVEDLLATLQSHRRDWRNVTESDLITMMANATKQRFELRDGKIRAYYGHSVPQPIQRTPVEPPAILYHGTAPETAAIILKEGLKSMNRQHVHLSTDQATAQMVGARHDSQPIILEIQALAAHRAGIAFYAGNEDVWLAEDIPADFIKRP